MSRSRSKKNQDKDTTLKTCTECQKSKNINQFYMCNNVLFTDGRSPICKTCINEKIDINNMETVYEILRQMDLPFIYDCWSKAVKNKGSQFGHYMRMINSLHQYKNLAWKDSCFTPEGDIDQENITKNLEIPKKLKDKWGLNYDYDEIMKLEKFSDEMMTSHDISAPQHKKLLILMCKLNLKMDKCLEKDDIAGFSKLHEQYQKLLTSSGFRPIDSKSGSELSGIRTFSQIYEEVEKDGFIKPIPINEHQDIVDRTIQYILNYTLKLLNAQKLAEPPTDTPKMDD